MRLGLLCPHKFRPHPEERPKAASRRMAASWALLLFLSWVTPVHAQSPDTVLINGKIVVYDAPPAQALAVRDGKITGIGSASEIRALAGPGTRVIDLGG